MIRCLDTALCFDRRMLLLCVALTVPAAALAERPNVLFIAVDDLRPQMQCYGMPELITPHLDRLAARGVRFDHAYCNIAVCGASRASLMKGLRPHARRFTSYLTRADKDAADVPSLPLTFRKNGYVTQSNGKIYHHRDDDDEAWSKPPWRPERSSLWWAKPQNRPQKGASKRGPAFEAANVPDSEYPDHMLCDKSLQDLQQLAENDAPFFLACGFWRPHLPFVAPQKYWDLYPEADIRLPDNMFFPRQLSSSFAYSWGEMRSYTGIPQKGAVSDQTARDLIRGYDACVSFVDVQVGRLLDELHRLQIADNTIIVLWGDHGWQLGEHGFWCKHTNFEVATRTPLLIAAPGVNGGRTCAQLVEFVDIYPTLCDLAELTPPPHLQGQSLRPLLNNVDAKFKDAVFTRHGGGDSVRTKDYRYMEMRGNKGTGQLLGVGLFDLRSDPAENQDVSHDPAYASIRTRLQSLLRASIEATTAP